MKTGKTVCARALREFPGRGQNGQFVAGCRGGPGRPRAPRPLTERVRAVLSRIDVDALADAALTGDGAAQAKLRALVNLATIGGVALNTGGRFERLIVREYAVSSAAIEENLATIEL